MADKIRPIFAWQTTDFCWLILFADEIGQLYRSSDISFTAYLCYFLWWYNRFHRCSHSWPTKWLCRLIIGNCGITELNHGLECLFNTHSHQCEQYFNSYTDIKTWRVNSKQTQVANTTNNCGHLISEPLLYSIRHLHYQKTHNHWDIRFHFLSLDQFSPGDSICTAVPGVYLVCILRTDFMDTRTALWLFSLFQFFSSFQLSLFPSILVFLSKVSYLSHNHLFLDFYFSLF